MHCQDVIEMLSPYMDGALDTADHEVIQAHLACCPSCRSEWEELTLSIGLLQELPELTPPAGFRAELMEKIDQLSAPAQLPQHKHWFERVTEVTRKSWYRTAAVAAVAAMTMGLTALWEKDGNQFLPIDPKPPQVAVDQETRDKDVPNKPDNSQTVQPGKDTPQKPDSGTSGSGSNPTTPKTTVATGASVTTQNSGGKSVESYVPQSSEGMAARSTTLKLDIQDFDAALRKLGAIIQANNGSIVTPYLEKDGIGTIGIKVPVASYKSKSVDAQLQALGVVISYLPVETDLSDQHQQAKETIKQLQDKVVELNGKLAEGANQQLENELQAAQTDLNQQIKAIKQLEERSTYGIINLTLM